MSTRATRSFQGTFLVLALLWATAKDAEAQQRKGLFWGGSVGGGALSCDGCASGALASGELHGALMLHDRFAISLEASVMGGLQQAADETVGFGVVAQGWVHRKGWVKAGIGGLQFLPRDSRLTADTESGLAIISAAGAEVWRGDGDKLVLGLQVRFMTVKYEALRVNTFSFHVGLDLF